MSNDQVAATPDTENSLYLGALATAVVSLLPYINVFIVPAFIIGAVVAVWHAAKRRERALRYQEGAKLGFLSTFFGTLVAAILVDLVWLFFDYQLWQRQNSQLMLAIFASFMKPATLDAVRDQFAQQEAKPFQWFLLLFQLIGNAIFCGIFGTLSGVVAVKIFRPSGPR